MIIEWLGRFTNTANKVDPAQTRLRHMTRLCHAGSILAGVRHCISNANDCGPVLRKTEPTIDRSVPYAQFVGSQF